MLAIVLLLAGIAASASYASVLPANPQMPTNAQLITIGGISDGQTQSIVELFSFANNSHARGADLPKDTTAGFGGVILNNTIYVSSLPIGRQTFQTYDILNNKWKRLPDVPYHKQGDYFATVLVNDTIFYLTDNTAYKYNIAKRVWQRASPLPVESGAEICAVTYQSSIYVLDQKTGNAFRSDDAANSWRNLSSASNTDSKFGASCVALPYTGVILRIGGENADGKSVASTYAYDIKADTWKTMAPMLKERDYAQAVVIPADSSEETVAVCGGHDSVNGTDVQYADCELYDAAKNQWTPAAFGLTNKRERFSLFVSIPIENFAS